MYFISKINLFLFLFILLIFSCKKKQEEITPYKEPLEYIQLTYPNYFPEMTLNTSNRLSKEGVALGRKLYYDTLLSNDGRSCSSCHNQTESFSKQSVNSLAHINLAWHSSFLWDGSVGSTLEDAMIFEVGTFFGTDVSKLQNHSEYPSLFEKVFGSKQISVNQVAFALAQFTRSMISSNSKYDRYKKGELQLTPQELNGLDIFFTERGDCFHCHTLGLFTDNSYHNTGLDDNFNELNSGRYLFTNNSADIGKFKTPTLRNIEFTPPYMHDGRYLTLEQVIEFYNNGVKISPYVDPIMTKPGKEFGLGLSTQDKNDLIAFLKTLSDTSFLNNPQFSKP
ncbi:MAG: cytochrome-c peroxidase [Flavobacteriia bacterium]|nr:cytochrome-c peroxidase [Flavobacteriia bacterium]